jgi:hypothetical protein
MMVVFAQNAYYFSRLPRMLQTAHNPKKKANERLRYEDFCVRLPSLHWQVTSHGGREQQERALGRDWRPELRISLG